MCDPVGALFVAFGGALEYALALTLLLFSMLWSRKVHRVMFGELPEFDNSPDAYEHFQTVKKKYRDELRGRAGREPCHCQRCKRG